MPFGVSCARGVAAVAFFVATLATQPAEALAPDTALRGYVHDVWQIDDGLPNNTIKAIAVPADGYLWLGTQEGLARFDGARFVLFTKENTAGLGGSAIQSLYTARDGALWIGT